MRRRTITTNKGPGRQRAVYREVEVQGSCMLLGCLLLSLLLLLLLVVVVVVVVAVVVIVAIVIAVVVLVLVVFRGFDVDVDIVVVVVMVPAHPRRSQKFGSGGLLRQSRTFGTLSQRIHVADVRCLWNMEIVNSC